MYNSFQNILREMYIVQRHAIHQNICCSETSIMIYSMSLYKVYFAYKLGKCMMLSFWIMALLSWIKTPHFSQHFKRTIRPTETCYLQNDLSCFDESFATKHVSVPGIFRLQIATMYDNVAFPIMALFVMDQNTTLFTKL